MGKMMRRMFVVAVNLAVLLVLLELSAVVYFYLTSSEFFYLRRKPVDGDVEQRVNAPFTTQSGWRAQIHPYFAFNQVPRSPPFQNGLYYNNHGFLQAEEPVKRDPACCDFPTRRQGPEDFIIGVFGGSVAAGFAVFAQAHDTFVSELGKSPALAGKRIRVVNFAGGGYKQPQQIIILAYYLSLGQPFDAIVNLDGFN